jgi:hypothetical protein
MLVEKINRLEINNNEDAELISNASGEEMQDDIDENHNIAIECQGKSESKM